METNEIKDEKTTEEQPYIDETNGEPVKMSLTEKAMLIMETKKDLKALRSELVNAGDDDKVSEIKKLIEEKGETLRIMMIDFNNHIDIKADQIRTEEAIIEMRKKRKAELYEMDETSNNFIERTKRYIMDALMWLTAGEEVHSHKTPYRRYNVKPTSGAVIITGEVPEIFKTTPKPPEARPDLTAIKKHIEDFGAEYVKFAHIEKKLSLTIK
jgi:hypothetical protein